MFRVMIEESTNLGVVKTLDLVMKTEKLYELLGRYMVKYGVPDQLYTEGGISELDYYLPHESERGKYIAANVGYCRISKDDKRTSFKSTQPIIVQRATQYVAPPIVPEEPPEERLQEMITAGVLTR